MPFLGRDLWVSFDVSLKSYVCNSAYMSLGMICLPLGEKMCIFHHSLRCVCGPEKINNSVTK